MADMEPVLLEKRLCLRGVIGDGPRRIQLSGHRSSMSNRWFAAAGDQPFRGRPRGNDDRLTVGFAPPADRRWRMQNLACGRCQSHSLAKRVQQPPGQSKPRTPAGHRRPSASGQRPKPCPIIGVMDCHRGPGVVRIASLLAAVVIVGGSGGCGGRLPLAWPETGASDVCPVEVTGSRFEWSFRYPGRDGRFGTDDDLVSTRDLHLPRGAIVGAISRPSGEVMVPRGDSVIEAGDRVLLFCLERLVPELESAFISGSGRETA